MGHGVPTNPNNIAPTIATEPHRDVKVFGEPRSDKRHPNTLWDAEDIEHYKQLLKTSSEFRRLFSELQSKMDDRIGKPIDVPQPQKGSDGAWLYPGDYFPDLPGRPHADDPVVRFSRFLQRDSEAIVSLGFLYALTDNEKYANYARELLLAYANLPRYGPAKTMNYRYAKGLTNQVLEDALNLELIARGYDLIYNSPSLSPADHVRIHDELIQPLAWVMLYPETPERDPGSTFASQINNRGAIGAAAVLMAGYATDDEELVRAALYGTRTTLLKSQAPHYKQFPPPKDWVAATADHPSLGLLTVHLAAPGITGGMWVEGSPAYGLYALAALINAAEAAWRHGLDLYSYNDAILKYIFDFPLLLAYPDLSDPGENNSRRTRLTGIYYPGLYEYGYRRYRDPRYLRVIHAPADRSVPAKELNGAPSGNTNAESSRYLIYRWLPSAPPSFLYDLDSRDQPPPPVLPSVNFSAVGFGVLRVPASNGHGIQDLTLSYGPSASHGHPDKLHIDLWALGDILMPSPGVQYPYNTPLDAKWHWTTLANNTLTVDEASQHSVNHPVEKQVVHADQTVFGPADTMGIQRAWSDTAYPGVTMDRSVCLTGSYLADLFAAFSDAPHRYDLAWHVRGDPSSDLPFVVSPFPDPVPNGYNAFTEVRQAPPTNGPWSIDFGSGDRFARLLAAGGASTQPILGAGGVYADMGPGDRPTLPTAATVIERRDTASTVFGNVLDLSGAKAGAVKDVTQHGDRESGFGLLRIETRDGVDLCFASYQPGVHSAPGIETDALQAMAQMKGPSPRALYLGGGTILKVGDAILQRSEEGLASIEVGAKGGYLLANPSPSPATITVTLKALEGLEAFDLDGQGQPKGKAKVVAKGGGAISARLEAGGRIGFFPPGAP